MAVALSFAGATACFAANAHVGTWKVNEAKSKFAPGVGKKGQIFSEIVFVAALFKSNGRFRHLIGSVAMIRPAGLYSSASMALDVVRKPLLQLSEAGRVRV